MGRNICPYEYSVCIAWSLVLLVEVGLINLRSLVGWLEIDIIFVIVWIPELFIHCLV